MTLFDPARADLVAQLTGHPTGRQRPPRARRDPRPRQLSPTGHRERALRALRRARIEDAVHRKAVRRYEQAQHEEPPTDAAPDPMPLIRSEERGQRHASQAAAVLDRVELFDRTSQRRAEGGAQGATYGAWEGGNGGPSRMPYPSASTGSLRA
jgi:hypothetical protein